MKGKKQNKKQNKQENKKQNKQEKDTSQEPFDYQLIEDFRKKIFEDPEVQQNWKEIKEKLNS